MPYFKWVGVDIVGTESQGKLAATSVEELSLELFRRGIALVSAKAIWTPSCVWPFDAQMKYQLFKQKAKLLRSGVLLPDVLRAVGHQVENPYIYDVYTVISQDIQRGIGLAVAFQKHSVFDEPLVAVMLAAGEESGSVVSAFEGIALYFYKQHLFVKKIRSIVAVPIITLLFFIGISVFIFICIIPRFADMLLSLQQELPPITRAMMAVSSFLTSYSMVYLMCGIGIASFFSFRYAATASGKKVLTKMLFHIPGIGKALWCYGVAQGLQSVSLLIERGVPLVDSLQIVSNSLRYDSVKEVFAFLYQQVLEGQLLSDAIASVSLFFPQVVALVSVGQRSGTLGQSLGEAALVYTEALDAFLERFIFLLQPTIIIALGLLVTLLIAAVYSPIMQLSHIL